MADGAGFVFTLPESVTITDRVPVAAEIVQPWIETIIRLFDDETFYQSECDKAKKAAERFLPGVLSPQYANFFRKIIARQ